MRCGADADCSWEHDGIGSWAGKKELSGSGDRGIEAIVMSAK